MIAALAAAAVLLAAFAVIETRSADPLLPIRVLRSRDRSGAYLIAPVGAACVAPPSARSLECGQALVLVPWPLALRTLVTRYLCAYGPATSQHFARWLAIPPRSAAGLFGRLADALKRVELDGQPGWTLAGDTATPSGPHRGIRLLPYFDAYVVAGQPRERLYPGAAANRALTPSGQAGNYPVLLVDGAVGGRESFDAVVSNATLHHLPDARAALRRLSQLVRPGGTLAIVGFTRTEWRDWPWALTAFACLGAANRVRGKWEHTAPQAWPPPDTFRQLRRSLREVLPGARISRLLMGRYLIIWHAPG